jgi:hypothetical protein
VSRYSNSLIYAAESHFFALRRLKKLCEQFLGFGEGKISDELITLKKFASNLAMKEPGDPHLLYDPNYTALSFRGRVLSLSKLQTGLNDLVKETWDKLLALSGGHKIDVEVPPNMSEDLRCTDPGVTFMDRVKTNPETLPLISEMFQHSNIALVRQTNAPCGIQHEVDAGAAQEFFHLVQPIMEAITFLLHTTGSGPLRLTEVVNDRYCNGASPRNLFIAHDLIFLLRRDLKPSGAKGYRSTVLHFPPPKVTDLLVYYLAVVRPVEIFLTASLGWSDKMFNYSQFLYVVKGKKITPRELSGIVAHHTDKYLECQLTGRDFRHVLINIQRVFLPPIVDPSVQQIRDTQAGHSTHTANRVYGQRIDHMPGEEAAMFVLAHRWCTKLHTLLGLGPEKSPIRPIPFLHAPSEPTWWSPSDYIPPPPPSTHEMMGQVRMFVDSAMASVTDEIAMRCEKIVKDSIFQAFAATVALSAKTGPSAAQPLVAPDNFEAIPSGSDIVRFEL